MPKHDKPGVVIAPTPEQRAQIESLQHRVQSGIATLEASAFINRRRFQELEPKHLRVGVNSALINASALATLLIRKGVITAEEYFDTLIEFWEYEVTSYQNMLTNHVGPGVVI